MALRLDHEKRIIGGVCAGISKELVLDPIVVRLVFTLAFVLWGAGPIIYIILWLVLYLSEGKN